MSDDVLLAWSMVDALSIATATELAKLRAAGIDVDEGVARLQHFAEWAMAHGPG